MGSFKETNCRTEFNIPGEYLFCNDVAHTNDFPPVYNKICSGTLLRRSQSTGNVRKHLNSNKSKHDYNSAGDIMCKSVYTKEAAEDTSHKPKGKRSNHSESMRITCENLHSPKCDSRKKRDSEFLAHELQSMLDNNTNDLNNLKRASFVASPHIQIKETSFTIDYDIGEVTLPNLSGQVTASTRTSASRRTLSCKSVQRRPSNLFSISQYIKNRHTQRSKSFATIREFSNYDANYEKNSTRNEDRKESTRELNKTRSFTSQTEFIPIETTKIFDINHTDARGNSCLHHASSNGDVPTIKYLLEQGGDVWLKNDEHSLPLDLAQNFQTAKLLSSATLFYSEQNESKTDKNIVQTSKLNIAL